jgi:hypothetical protein
VKRRNISGESMKTTAWRALAALAAACSAKALGSYFINLAGSGKISS